MAGFFSRLKGKDGPSKVKKAIQQTNAEPAAKPRWEDAWMRTNVEPEEVQQLLRGCTAELKSRGKDVTILLEGYMQLPLPSSALHRLTAICSSGHAIPSSTLPTNLRSQRSANFYSKFL